MLLYLPEIAQCKILITTTIVHICNLIISTGPLLLSCLLPSAISVHNLKCNNRFYCLKYFNNLKQFLHEQSLVMDGVQLFLTLKKSFTLFGQENCKQMEG